MLKRSQLHPYQVRGYNHIIDNLASGLFMEMGLGKTVTTLTAIEDLIYDSLEIASALIVAPKRVVESVWTQEINNWEHLKHLKTVRIIGTPKQRLAAIKEEADIYLISRDNLAWLCGQFGGGTLPYDMLVIDESSSFKNHKSIRFKSLKGVLDSFTRRVILTGTPAPNTLIDLWAQIYVLDKGERLGKRIGDYRNEYFKPGHTNGHIVYTYSIKRDSNTEIYNAINDICISMKSEDYLDLPGRLNNYIKIILPKKIRKQYDDFEEEQVLELFGDFEEGDIIPAVNAAALSNKLLQFANGAVYDEDKNWFEVHDLKIKAAVEIVEAAVGQPMLIAYNYKHDKLRLLEALKAYDPVILKTEQHIEDWNAGKIKVLMMHPASGGHGLNLQKGGNKILWFGNNWSLELYQQFNARLDRQGQKNLVVINHLVAMDTIDTRVIDAIHRKSRKQEGLMQAIKAKIDQYILKRKKSV